MKKTIQSASFAFVLLFVSLSCVAISTPIPPTVTPSPIPSLTSTPIDSVCTTQNLTLEECANVGEHQYDIVMTYELPGVCEGAGYPYYGVETNVTFENDTVTIVRKEWGTEKGTQVDVNIYFSSFKSSRLNTETYYKFSGEGIVIEGKSNGTLCSIETMTIVK